MHANRAHLLTCRLGELRLLRLAVVPAAAAVLTVLLGGELRLLRLAGCGLPIVAKAVPTRPEDPTGPGATTRFGRIESVDDVVLPAAAAVLTVLLRRLEAADAVLPVLLLLRTHTRTHAHMHTLSTQCGRLGSLCPLIARECL